MISTQAQGLHFGNSMDMGQALKDVPGNILVFGNIDPVHMFKMAQASELRDSIYELLDQAADHPNFVLSTGCDTPPGVPVENIRSFFKAAANHSIGHAVM
jgi:uroporphyrinogen decarboxylase